MFEHLSAGQTIPNTTVATMDGGNIAAHKLHDLLGTGTHVIIGVPGAFTPVCTHKHLPSIIDVADQIIQSGIDDIFCISDDNPWTIEAWKKEIKNADKIKFLSDGNKEFLNACGLSNNQPELFLKGALKRFYVIVQNKKVIQMRIEDNVLSIDCTNGTTIQTDVDRAYKEAE